MKRRDLERHLRVSGCILIREGAKHSVYRNPQAGKTATVSRHSEIWPRMVEAICKELDIPRPNKR